MLVMEIREMLRVANWADSIQPISGVAGFMPVLTLLFVRVYWGEPERAPHLPYCCAKSSLYIYILYNYIYRISSNIRRGYYSFH